MARGKLFISFRGNEQQTTTKAKEKNGPHGTN